MGLLSALFGKKNKNAPVKPAPPQTTPRQTEPVYLTQTAVFGRGDSSVYFVDENRGIKKLLVDSAGNIRHFPGIVEEPFWAGKVSGKALLPKIRYRTGFEKREDRWLMLWTVQPDGDYWRDDSGFGAGNEEEVVLYTYVDGNGDFTGPFRIYALGDMCCALDRFEFAHANRYRSALQALRSGKMEDHVDVLFPRLYGMDLRAGIRSLGEIYTICDEGRAREYWAHPVLSAHLREASRALLQLDLPILQIVGHPEEKIVQACMTLFYSVSKEPVFKEVLDKFFDGKQEAYTAEKLSQ